LLRWPSLRTPKSRNWTLGGLGSSLRSGFAILEFSPQTCTNNDAGSHSWKEYPEHSRRISLTIAEKIELEGKYAVCTFLLIDKLATSVNGKDPKVIAEGGVITRWKRIDMSLRGRRLCLASVLEEGVQSIE
jgi:hypothetical protein